MLSGVPIGLALAMTEISPATLLAVFLTLDSGHLVASVAVAWAHRDFRQTMLSRKVKYVIIPIAILVAGTICGATVAKIFQVNPVRLTVLVSDYHDYLRPLIALLPVFFIWNAYHYGKQNYGFVRLFCPAVDGIAAMQWAMFGTLFGLIIFPDVFHAPQVSLFLFGLIIFNHQLAAIGLASHVWANHWGRNPLWFAGALIMFGSGMAWLILHAAAQAAMVVIGLRVTAGFAHFLYDRWIWKFSDPQVRETIGKDLFAAPVPVPAKADYGLRPAEAD